MNRKGTYAADTAPFYAIFAIFVSILFIAAVFIMNSYSTDKVEVPKGLDAYLSYQRFFRSADCFVSEDISGRVNTLILDCNKFTQEKINDCYKGNENTPGFRLKLEYGETTKNIQTSNWNNERSFERGVPKNVLVLCDDKEYDGKLTIEVQDV